MRHCIIIVKWQGRGQKGTDFEHDFEHQWEAALLYESIHGEPFERFRSGASAIPGPRIRGSRRCSRFDFLRIFFQGYRRETLLSVH